MQLLNLLLWLLSAPFVFLLVRALLYTINYQLWRRRYKAINPSMPVLDPGVLFRFGVPDDIHTQMEQLNKMGGGKVPPVVFAGPYLGQGRPTLLISSPELIHEVGDDVKFPKMPELYDALSFFIGRGLVSAAGKHWKDSRHAMNPIFFAGRLKLMTDGIVRCGEDMIQDLKKDPGFIDVNNLMGHVTQRILIDSLFSNKLDYHEVSQSWGAANAAFANYVLGALILGDSINQFNPYAIIVRNNKRKLDALLQPLIKAARQDPSPPDEDNKDFIETMVTLCDDQGNLLFDDQEIMDQCTTMLFAGHDTTRNTVAWTLYYLCSYPEELQKIRKEVEEVTGGRPLSHGDIPKLRRCKNALQETMRIRSVVPFVERYASEDCELGGFIIFKNTSLRMQLAGPALDESLWENAWEYNPDRFEKETLYTQKWVPFSVGARDCIGKKFAIIEGTLLIAMLAQNFDVEIDKSRKIVSLFEGTVAPSGFRCKFIPVAQKSNVK